MIDKRELRIGNIILADYDMGEVLEVWQVQIRFRKLHPLLGFDDVEIIHLNNVHPVPLTPELLEKCGFALNDSGYDKPHSIHIYDDTYLHVFIKRERALIGAYEKWCGCDCHTNVWHGITPIHSLHQLQNLIYILSGNELNVEI